MKRYVLPCVVCREGGGLCPGGWSTRLWPLLHLDGRSNGPGSINRLVTPSTWTKLCILFFWIIFRKYCFTHIVKNGIVRNAEVNGSTEKLAVRTVVSSGIQLWYEAYINWEIILFECTILGIPDSFWWRYAEFKYHPCWHSVVGGDKEDYTRNIASLLCPTLSNTIEKWK